MFKANIEVTTIEEFKTLVDTKIVNVSNKVEEAKEVAKEVAVDPNSLCPCCGSKEVDIVPDIEWDYIDQNDIHYNLKNKICKVCNFNYYTK